METLNNIYKKYAAIPNTIIDNMHAEWGGDKGGTHSYIEIYSKLFEKIRDNKLNILEIGVMYGSSMKMWKEYFINSNIFGIDIREHCKKYEEDRVKINILDIKNKKEIDKKLKGIKFDIIIDDSTHNIDDQQQIFKSLYDKLNDNGLYIIEDIQNIDRDKDKLLSLHEYTEIIDLRNIKNRYDDVLVVIKKNKKIEDNGLFRGTNTIEHWNNKHIEQYEVNKDFDYSKMGELSYIKIANDLIKQNSEVFKIKSILDVGCAVGKALNYFKKNIPQFSCYGIDFSPSAIEAARKKVFNVNFQLRDILLNPINIDYGCITILEAIEHFKEGINYKILDNILEHCEYAIISTVDTEDNCFGEHISHYKIDTFEKMGYNVIWKSYLDEIKMPNGIYHYMIFLIRGKLSD